MTGVETSHYTARCARGGRMGEWENGIRKIDFNQFSCLQIGIGGVGRGGEKGMQTSFL